jgi:asparagine synthase (glutamine-hydrolysing)
MLEDYRAVVFGHRRLSILDLSELAAQPMIDGSGRYVITYNGEIYNYLEVRSELSQRGVSFRTRSDTEVILEAYKAWGTQCLGRLNGMFAFAVYDSVRGVLFCARDRYGEKPFLYSFGKSCFVFASEYKAILLWPELRLEIDELRLVRAAYNQSTGLDADRQTVFARVEQLLPGEAMEVDVHTLQRRVWRYWQVQPSQAETELCKEQVFDEFRELLVDSVRLRMRSDVTVGSCLSGGLDSSAIVCIASRLAGHEQPYHTFTGRFPATAADEWRYAKETVDATGVASHVVEPTVDRFVEELPTFMWHNELPVGSSSQYAQWCVFRLARDHGVTVLLDGQGADELLGGYEQYFARYVQSLRELGESERLSREMPVIRKRYPLALVPPARALRDRLPFRLRHWLSNKFGVGTSLLYGLKPDVARLVSEGSKPPRRAEFSALHDALEADSFGRYLTTLLRYGDRNSMAHSREVRLPFCDHRLAEFVFRLPPHLLMGNVRTKRLLREGMRGILPEAITTRWNKQGFQPPQGLWFASPRFRGLVKDTLSSNSFRASPLWKPTWWDRAMMRMEAGEAELGWTMWHPFQIEAWRQHFLSPVLKARSRAALRPGP